jgi:hypothetical protein
MGLAELRNHYREETDKTPTCNMDYISWLENKIIYPDQTKIIHGVNCKKAIHTEAGHLHGEGDDTPFCVNGRWYCGRCHYSVPKQE